MWPRLLLDLLPHFARLMPVADKYLAGRSASDKAHEAALAALGADVRSQVGQVNEAHAGLSRQLQQQNTQITEMGVDVTRARMGIESVEERVAKLEQAVAKTMRVAIAALVLMFVIASMLAIVLLDLRAR